MAFPRGHGDHVGQRVANGLVLRAGSLLMQHPL